MPLKQLVNSSQQTARKVAGHLLKTTALMINLQHDQNYAQVLPPSTLAYTAD